MRQKGAVVAPRTQIHPFGGFCVKYPYVSQHSSGRILHRYGAIPGTGALWKYLTNSLHPSLPGSAGTTGPGYYRREIIRAPMGQVAPLIMPKV